MYMYIYTHTHTYVCIKGMHHFQFHSSPDMCPLSNEAKEFISYFHFQIPDTWQWLVASSTQLATLLPTELAIGVCRTPLRRKLAASMTTSLYTKATASASFQAPITAIRTMSMSSRTDGQEL